MHWVSFRSKSLSYHYAKLRTGYQSLENDRGARIALSPSQRRRVGVLSRIVNVGPFVRRWWLAKAAVFAAPGAPKMVDGYALVSPMPGYERLLEICERQMAIYEEYLAEGIVALRRRGIDPAAYESEMVKTRDDPLKHVPCHYDPGVVRAMAEFALQPALVATAARYLGVAPVLQGFRLLYSPNAEAKLDKAQLFHLDPEGARQAKAFVAVRRVAAENSPFTFLTAQASHRLLRSGKAVFQAKRVADKQVEQIVAKDQWVRHVGEAGDGLFVDTSRCFHFGSRPNRSPRVLFYFSYLDPFGSFFPVFDPLQRKSPKARAGGRWPADIGAEAALADYVLSRRL